MHTTYHTFDSLPFTMPGCKSLMSAHVTVCCLLVTNQTAILSVQGSSCLSSNVHCCLSLHFFTSFQPGTPENCLCRAKFAAVWSDTAGVVHRAFDTGVKAQEALLLAELHSVGGKGSQIVALDVCSVRKVLVCGDNTGRVLAYQLPPTLFLPNPAGKSCVNSAPPPPPPRRPASSSLRPLTMCPFPLPQYHHCVVWVKNMMSDACYISLLCYLSALQVSTHSWFAVPWP